MPDIMSTLGSVFKSPAFGPAVSGGTLALGEVGNLLAGRQQQNAYNNITKLTPQQIGAEASATAAPLDKALTESVTNQVSGDLASRGLSQAPGILASTESQALAPYAYQNYQAALQAILQKLGLNLNAAQLLPKGQNLTPAMMLFLQQMAKLKQTNASGGAGGTLPTNTGLGAPGATPPFIDPSSMPAPGSFTPQPIDLTNPTADLSALGAQ
jgi:hypothetical protein